MENIISKIQKLFALAERGGTEAEAENAMRRAQEMLLKYNLSMADVASVDEPEEKTGIEMVPMDAKRNWEAYIMMGIAELYFCKSITHISKIQRYYILVGKPSNIAVAKDVSKYIIRMALRLAAVYADDLPGKRREAKAAFLMGFGHRILERCRQMVAQAKANTNDCTAIVIYDNSKQEIQEALDDAGIKFHSKAISVNLSDARGRYIGEQKANDVNLGATGIGHQQKRTGYIS